MKLRKTLLSKPFNAWSYPWVAGTLLIFLISSSLLWGQKPISGYLTASREQVFQHHEYYRLFTTIAMHADIRHFMGNAIFFWIFGFLLHSYFGKVWFPTLAILFGAVANAVTLALYPPHTTLLGASGVVYFMAGAWATLFFLIERKTHWMKRMLAAVGVSLVLFFPSAYEPEVSYLAHAVGFGFGMIVAYVFFKINRDQIRKEEYWEQDWMALVMELEPEVLDIKPEAE
jgi:rhomboid protease GluP